jgi:PPM family protein phosphatase
MESEKILIIPDNTLHNMQIYLTKQIRESSTIPLKQLAVIKKLDVPQIQYLEYSVLTDWGCVRENNEDSSFCLPPQGVFVVCDGMGGHAAGEVASSLAVQAVADFLTPERLVAIEEYPEEILFASIDAADQAIITDTQQYPEHKGMGSTIVLAVCRGEKVHLANLGDSRAYLLHNGTLLPCLPDHSIAYLLYQQGIISYEEIRTSPQRNQLNGALGQRRGVKPNYTCLPFQVGDRLLLCSDGLWDELPDETIALILTRGASLQSIALDLVNAAKANGGNDNITVVLMEKKENKNETEEGEKNDTNNRP